MADKNPIITVDLNMFSQDAEAKTTEANKVAKSLGISDEALAKAVVDISGRPYCVCTGEPEGFEYCMIGGHFTGSLVRHVMESIAMHAGICLHLHVISGRDPHHIAEAEFKALARALRFAIEPDPRVDGIPSTKGAL
jgi:imidazoleglycerol-phosphate dehydratase